MIDTDIPTERRSALRFGATLIGNSRTHFRVWAPKAKKVDVALNHADRTEQQRTTSLKRKDNGIFECVVDNCPAGTQYRFQLDNRAPRPDPYSRFQPQGVHGPSEVIDPNAHSWSDVNWKGHENRELVIYEMHLGSFTQEGTYLAAIDRLDQLVELGATAVELLPLSQTPGKWNWGYDGVNYFAPRNSYGSPDQLKQFVDACHNRSIAVILDVVYNHVGPEGNYLNEFGPYRSKKFGTPWGDSLNFCGPNNQLVREFVISNVIYWLDEYHFDGLRLDAIHYMFDDSDFSIVDEIHQKFREFEKTQDRKLHLIAEANIFDSELIGNTAAGRNHYDAIWSDCLMHSIYAHGCPTLRLTNRKYNHDDLPSALEHAYIFAAPDAVRVDASRRQELHPNEDKSYIGSLIMALQTHDSVGNHPHGKRLHQLTSIEFQKAAAPLLLLYPSIPMIFMGEEWATNAPFPFFADFEDDKLRKAVDKGRRDEYPHHDWSDSPLPSDPLAFFNSKMTNENQNFEMWDWYRAVLQFRKLGIKQGWLSVANWSTSVNDKHCFGMSYEQDDRRVQICARLAPPEDESILLNFTRDVEICLDSQTSETRQTDSIELETRHCCVWIEAINL